MQHGVKRVHLSEQARKSKVEKDRAKIANYRALTERVLDGKANQTYNKDALQDTTTILGLNPEFNAVWNYRRKIFSRLILAGQIDAIEALNNDLHMSMEMMKRFPKCYWIWNHRRWCLETLDIMNGANWERELAIALKVLLMDSRNFHGWHYRRYVVDQLERKTHTMVNSWQKELALNLQEFDYTTEVINKSTSNFSAWHNRTKLIPKIFKLLRESSGDSDKIGDLAEKRKSIEIFDTPLKLLKHELNLVKTGMFMDADDTSVWLYMQWLLTDTLFLESVSKESYMEILRQQLKDVNELNELEKEDSIGGSENVWCLKTIIFLRVLMARAKDEASNVGVDEEIVRILSLLVKLDPLRKGHYVDQILGKASIIL